MSSLTLIEQVDVHLAHPILQHRRRLYDTLKELFVQQVQPVERFGLMLRDGKGQPIVGPLEQMVRSVVLPDASNTTAQTAAHPLLIKLMGDATLLNRCRDQLLARQAVRCLNQSIERLVVLHQQHRIFLNREDIQRLSEIYALLDYSMLASVFDLRPLDQLFHQPHHDVIGVPINEQYLLA